MPRVTIAVGHDFAQFPHENVAITDADGVELAQINISPDPLFNKFKGNGNMKHHKHRHPKNHHGHHHHVRKTKKQPRPTRQNRAAKRHHHSHHQNGDIQITSTPPDPTEEQVMIPGPIPEVTVIDASALGYPDGVYGVAPFYIMADPIAGGGDDAINSPLVTEAGPISEVTLADPNSCIKITFQDAIPAGVAGIGIGMTDTNDPSGTLYVQEIELVDSGVPDQVTLAGPWTGAETLAGANLTYLGGYRVLPEPEWWVGPAEADLEAMTVRLSYRLLSSNGWSASQGMTDWITCQAVPRAGLWWTPPDFPVGTVDWEGEYQLNTENDVWHSIAPERYSIVTPDHLTEEPADGSEHTTLENHYCVLYQQDVETYPNKNNAPELSDPSVTDYSGVPAPDMPFSDVSAVVPQTLTTTASEDVEARNTYAVDNDENPPTAPALLTVPPNSSIVINAPRLGELFPNNNLLEKDKHTHIEKYWANPTLPSGCVASFSSGLATTTDTSNETTDVDVRATAPAAIDPTTRYSFRAAVRISDYLSGAAQVVVRQFDALGNFLSDTALVTTNGITDSPLIGEIKAGPSGSESFLILDPSAASVQLVERHLGSAAAGFGARNLTSNLSHVIGEEGHATPRKRNLPRSKDSRTEFGSSAPGPVPDIEDVGTPYPPASYLVVVETPADGATRNVDVVSVQENFEYARFMNERWTLTNTGKGFSDFLASSAITGSYGWHLKAQSGGEAYATFDYDTTEALQLSQSNGIQETLYIVSLPSSGTATIASVHNLSGTIMGYVTLSSTGLMQLVAFDKNGASATSTIAFSASEGDWIRVKLMALYAGTLGGRLIASVQADNPDAIPVTAVLGSIDWSSASYLLNQARVGAWGTDAGAAFEFNVDSVLLLYPGETSTAAIPGNAVEYFGAPGSRGEGSHFLTGMKVPVTPGVPYCNSVFLETTGIQTAASLFNSVFADKHGKVIQRNGPLVSGIAGSLGGFYRFYQVLSAPDKAAYLKFVDGSVADGKIRCMGHMFEPGNFVSPFSSGFPTQGSIAPIINLGSPMPDGSAANPIGSLNKVKQVLRADAKVKLAKTGTSSYSAFFRSAPDDTGTHWSSWYSDVTLMPGNTYVQLKITLFGDGTNTPELKSIFFDFVRPVPILVRHDGTEYPGGAIVFNMSPEQHKYAIDPKVFADESQGFTTYGFKPQKSIGQMKLQCFLESTSREIVAAQGTGKARFDIEDPELNKRISVRFFDADFGKEETDRSLFDPVAGLDGDGIWILNSNVTNAQVLGHGSL